MGRRFPEAILAMAAAMVLGLLLGPLAPPAAASPLEQRQAQWPTWTLPAPLARPDTADLLYPDWFAGNWQVSSSDGASYRVRFQRCADGAVVGDRAFNARAVGQALLGEQLLRVANDPANPNRQIATLAGDQQLESTVIGRRSERPGPTSFLADELALQVLHRPGAPRLSQVEVLSRYERQADGSISAEQWLASFAAPGAGPGLIQEVRSTEHLSPQLVAAAPPPDHAS
jgi:hypothetical protein